LLKINIYLIHYAVSDSEAKIISSKEKKEKKRKEKKVKKEKIKEKFFTLKLNAPLQLSRDS
jgi:hypothetical protein